MNLTKYTALNVKITEYNKVNNQFSTGRARVFYEGANVNRTIINPDVAKDLIKSIPGTPIVGRYDNNNTDDFEGHGLGQIAYGFVPLEPNALKVEVTEEQLGLPVKRTYYEVDVIIWDGRFPEAKKILEEEKSLSMELNPDTLTGELEIYDDKHFFKITNAEFFGITVLGDGYTPCFKDAKFLQTYASMISAYESIAREQESNIGGKNMPNAEENVETVITDTTIANEEAPSVEAVVEEVETEEIETVEETIVEDTVEEITEEVEPVEETETVEETEPVEEFEAVEETEENEETEEVEEAEGTVEEEATEEPTEENVEENTEAEGVENYEVNLNSITSNQKRNLLEISFKDASKDGEDFYVKDFDDNYIYVCNWEEGTFRYGYTLTEDGFVFDLESKTRVLDGGYIEFSEEEGSSVEEIIGDLKSTVNSLNEKLETYENAAKEELVSKFSSKINDSEFMSGVKSNIATYSVEELKSILGAKLAEQVMVEEDGNEEGANGMVYSFNGAASKNTIAGWQDLVRASKASNANK